MRLDYNFVIFRKYYPLPRFDYRNNTVLLANKTGHERVDSTIAYRWENKIMKALPEYFFIQYTLSGCGIVEINGRVHKVDKGRAFLCSQDQPYLYYHNPAISDHWEFIWLGLSGLSGQLIFKSIQRDFGSIVELSPASKTVTRMFKALEFSERQQWDSIVKLSVFATTFLLGLIEDLRQANSLLSSGRMDEVLEYVRNHYQEAIDATTLSHQFGYSREHFTRLFKKWVGQTPGIFLSELRLEKAKELLRMTPLPLQTVAQQSGFANINYLCTVFRKQISVTPLQYRILNTARSEALS